MKRASLKLFLTLFVYVSATPVFAQEPGPATRELLGIIKRLTEWMLAVLLVVTVAFIVYAGYLYLTSQGDPEKLNEGKERFTSALIGLVFIIMSVFLLRVIGVDILGAPGL